MRLLEAGLEASLELGVIFGMRTFATLKILAKRHLASREAQGVMIHINKAWAFRVAGLLSERFLQNASPAWQAA
ncbi:hypothetical protein ACFSHR_21840 [Azotobacter chroococcum]|jgi:hypothetical protein